MTWDGIQKNMYNGNSFLATQVFPHTVSSQVISLNSSSSIWSNGIADPEWCVYNGNLILAGRGDPSMSTPQIASYNLVTGSMNWRVQYPPATQLITDLFQLGHTGSLTADVINQQILLAYVDPTPSSSSIHLISLNPYTGATLWDYNTNISILPNTIGANVLFSPMVGGAAVLIQYYPSAGTGTIVNLLFINSNGTVSWRNTITYPSTNIPSGYYFSQFDTGFSYNSPQLLNDGSNIYFIGAAGISQNPPGTDFNDFPYVASFNPSNGTINWQYAPSGLTVGGSSGSYTWKYGCSSMNSCLVNGNIYMLVFSNVTLGTVSQSPILMRFPTNGSAPTTAALSVPSGRSVGGYSRSMSGVLCDGTSIFTPIPLDNGTLCICVSNASTMAFQNSITITPYLSGNTYTNMSTRGLALFSDSVFLYLIAANPSIKTQPLLAVINKSTLSVTYSNMTLTFPYPNELIMTYSGHNTGGLFCDPSITKRLYYLGNSPNLYAFTS